MNMFSFYVYSNLSGMLSWQVTDRFVKYSSYPTMTNIKVPLARKLPFPTITFCNQNPIRKSMLNEAGQEIKDLVKDGLNYQVFVSNLIYSPTHVCIV